MTGRATRLEICLAWSERPPVPGQSFLDVHRGGPDTLLRWLETQLGLPWCGPAHVERVAALVQILTTDPRPSFEQSLERDSWSTAAELLARLDDLRLAGWDRRSAPGLPPLVDDLAAVLPDDGPVTRDTASRIELVLGALDAGQRLPDHECRLFDPPGSWPVVWQKVLGRLSTVDVPTPPPTACKSTALGTLQAQLLGAPPGHLTLDSSFRWISARSAFTASEALASALAADPDPLGETVVCCSDETVLAVLDGALARYGLATAGAVTRSPAHPVLQLLPLALRLCWKPVDPALLLDFLGLPVGPIPAPAARELTRALTDQPGLGSAAWEEARAELSTAENDEGGRIAGVLSRWLDVERHERGEPLPVASAVTRCRAVARWAAGRAKVTESGDPELAAKLRIAAEQASTLEALLEAQGDSVTEPQLARLLDAVSGSGVANAAQPMLAGGPCAVRSLADVDGPCRRLVWFGLGASTPPRSRWTRTERRVLAEHGIHLDDGSGAVQSLRAAECRGLARISHNLLAVELPEEEETPHHPLWQQVEVGLGASDDAGPVVLERALADLDPPDVGPWTLTTSSRRIEVPAASAVEWRVAPGLLKDRERSSATELITRLSCPLKWVLSYAAQLRPGAIGRLPGDFRLKGLFSHSVLEAVFSGSGAPPTETVAAAEAGRICDERLALDAAPLAQPARAADRMSLRKHVANAASELARLLAAGGYRVVGMEAAVEATVCERPLIGAIDCLLVDGSGNEAVIDFKYAGRTKFPELLRTGRAVQLATYAYARRHERGRWPAVAYLILADALLATPSGGPVNGARSAEVEEGPGIADVWDRFLLALDAGGAWLRDDEPIPVRPLQDPGDRSTGSELVIDEPTRGEPRSGVEPCRYCDYGVLCGVVEVQ